MDSMMPGKTSKPTDFLVSVCYRGESALGHSHYSNHCLNEDSEQLSSSCLQPKRFRRDLRRGLAALQEILGASRRSFAGAQTNSSLCLVSKLDVCVL